MQRLVYQAGSLPTKIVCLTQVVSTDELKDDEEYEDIVEDMRGEGGKYGKKIFQIFFFISDVILMATINS